MARGRGPNSFFYMWVSSCPSAIFFFEMTQRLILITLVKNQLTIDVWASFWTLLLEVLVILFYVW